MVIRLVCRVANAAPHSQLCHRLHQQHTGALARLHIAHRLQTASSLPTCAGALRICTLAAQRKDVSVAPNTSLLLALRQSPFLYGSRQRCCAFTFAADPIRGSASSGTRFVNSNWLTSSAMLKLTFTSHTVHTSCAQSRIAHPSRALCATRRRARRGSRTRAARARAPRRR